MLHYSTYHTSLNYPMIHKAHIGKNNIALCNSSPASSASATRVYSGISGGLARAGTVD